MDLKTLLQQLRESLPEGASLSIDIHIPAPPVNSVPVRTADDPVPPGPATT